MDKQFDELSKSLAEGVSRREALRKFGAGLAGVLLSAVGLNSKADARGGNNNCWDCSGSYVCSGSNLHPACKHANCNHCGGQICCGPVF